MAKRDSKTGKRMTAAAESASDETEAKAAGGVVSGNARKFIDTRPKGQKANAVVAVQFNRSWGAYNADERAGFSPTKANELVETGVARKAGTAKYVRPTDANAKAKEVKRRRAEGKSSKEATEEAAAEAKATSSGE